MADTRTKRRAEFRALQQKIELRDEGDSGTPTMVGTLAVFDEWTEINSRAEGNFLERISPSAFAKTMQENRASMRVLFQHGKDPQIGDKPLGPIANLYADDRGAHYEVPLLDTSYNRDIAEMLRSDPPVLGSSFRFEAMREDYVQRPGKSEHNPRGLPERTVLEARMPEFGPVVFPAYSSTSAGLRSLTDRYGDVDPEISTLDQMLTLAERYAGEDGVDVERVETLVASIREFAPADAVVETPDAEAEEPVSEEPPGAEGAAETDAPPDDRAGQFDHPIRMGRRDPDPLYTGQKEKPEWQL